MGFRETPDSNTPFRDREFISICQSDDYDGWVPIEELYPEGRTCPLLPSVLSIDQFQQGVQFDGFFLVTIAALLKNQNLICDCFITKYPRNDGRYSFRFFRDCEICYVEIDNLIPVADNLPYYTTSPTNNWWPLLLEKALAKFYGSFAKIDACSIHETYYDLTGKPVILIPLEPKLAKVCGASITEGMYWQELGQRISKGIFAVSAHSKNAGPEDFGLQVDQSYAIMDVISLTGSFSTTDILIRLYTPFDEDEYIGPMNRDDSAWTEKLYEKYRPDKRSNIYIPVRAFLRLFTNIQICYIRNTSEAVTYFRDEWKGETAGGNPTMVSWRKNPVYLIKNDDVEPRELVVTLKQKNQHAEMSTADYLLCGLVFTRPTYPNPLLTFYLVSNCHKIFHKSFFLNTREVGTVLSVPAKSFCYMLPTCMTKTESPFALSIHYFSGVSYDKVLIEKLKIPGINWSIPATERLTLSKKEQDRVDFFVDEPTPVHILVRQDTAKSTESGEVITLNCIGLYLYDDMDRKIARVHAATNYRETGFYHQLPHAGRYALSITCPEAAERVSLVISIATTFASGCRIVDPPEGAQAFDDVDVLEEQDEELIIDQKPYVFPETPILELPDSSSPWEDRGFYFDNPLGKGVDWMHLSELYPQGRSKPLLPSKLTKDQFLTARGGGSAFTACLIALIDNHSDAISRCFITKNARRDRRYTFKFYRNGIWEKVEIDDRIPTENKQPIFISSPTENWWPLLLEKAYAKFCTTYNNVESAIANEIFRDITSLPVINILFNEKLAKVNQFQYNDPLFWVDLNDMLKRTACTAISNEDGEQFGLKNMRYYAILGIVSITDNEPSLLSDVLVHVYSPDSTEVYVGPMNINDTMWTKKLLAKYNPKPSQDFYIPVDIFIQIFSAVQQLFIKNLVQPSRHFRTEWGEDTTGGNPSMITWRENPKYVVRNISDSHIQLVVSLDQKDQRRISHLLADNMCDYVNCGIVCVHSTTSRPIPTHLITGNNHPQISSGLFSDSRDTTFVFTIPPNSICYMVPSGMSRISARFILSYWYFEQGDQYSLSLERYQPAVALDMPAVATIELSEGEKKRVDFLTDIPTDLHILISQDLTTETESKNSILTSNFIGAYLYDSDNNRINGVHAALNYKDLGLVHKVNTAGRYAISVTCPKGKGIVPITISIVALEEAHIRITSTPDDAADLKAIDMSFLGERIDGVLLDYLHLYEDEYFDTLLQNLEDLEDEDNSDTEEDEKAVKELMIMYARERARHYIAAEREKYLKIPQGETLETLSALLDADADFTSKERERYQLRQDPRNAMRLHLCERELSAMAARIADNSRESDIQYVQEFPLGISRETLKLSDDPIFAKLSMEHRLLMRNKVRDAEKVIEAKERMNERAVELAHKIHEKERCYLPFEVQGVPLAILPLNSDEEFLRIENDLRKLRSTPKKDEKAIKELETTLLHRTKSLADELIKAERRNLLLNLPPGISINELSLDSDKAFRKLEVERLININAATPDDKALEILNGKIFSRLDEISRNCLKEDLSFLPTSFFGLELEEIQLKDNQMFNKKLAALREARKTNAPNIVQLENELKAIVQDLAKEKVSIERDFLDKEAHGRLREELPLDSDKQFITLEKKRRTLLLIGGEGSSELRTLEEQQNMRMFEIAKELNALERSSYLDSLIRGIPLLELPLNIDAVFESLEADRQRAIRGQNSKRQVEIETDLKNRADKLAEGTLSRDRGFLGAKIDGLSVNFISLDSDPFYSELEIQRRELLKNPRHNAALITEIEDQLTERAAILGRELTLKEREKFICESYQGIALTDLNCDEDQLFRQLESERLNLYLSDHQQNMPQIHELESQITAHLGSLANEIHNKEYFLLDPVIYGVDVRTIGITNDPECLRLKNEIRQQKNRSHNEEINVDELISELNERVKKMISDKLEIERQQYLPEEVCGRYISLLPLNTDSKFIDYERQYRQLVEKKHSSSDKDGTRYNEEIINLRNKLDERCTAIALSLNEVDRPKYLKGDFFGMTEDMLGLNHEKEFLELEEKRARLLRDPKLNAGAIVRVESELNEVAKNLATKYLASNRHFLDPKPEGIPLKYLPLDSDEDFIQLERKRMSLKVGNSKGNTQAIEEIENALNDCVLDIIDKLRVSARGSFLKPTHCGLSTDILKLDEDKQFHGYEIKHLLLQLEDSSDSKNTVKELQMLMNNRAEELARGCINDNRKLLRESTHELPLDDVDLDEFPDFVSLEVKTITARVKGKNVTQMTQDLQALAEDICVKVLSKNRAFLDQQPEGRLLDDLPLNSDRQFLGLERKRFEMMNADEPDDLAIDDIEERLNNRVHELAKNMNIADRSKFLIDNQLGTELSKLPLDTDILFSELEARRAALCRMSSDDGAIYEVEEALQQRAKELARNILASDRGYLPAQIDGVPLSFLNLDKDKEFHKMEIKRMAYRSGNTRKNMALISEVERELCELAEVLAGDYLKNLYALLDQEPLGIPITQISFREDEEFKELEACLHEVDSEENERAAIIEMMNARLSVIAASIHDKERAKLEQVFEGVPLSALSLNSDKSFLKLENELRLLSKYSTKNAARIAETHELLNRRLLELARESRQKYLNESIVPSSILSKYLDNDFFVLEGKLRDYENNDGNAINSENLEKLTKALKEKSSEISKKIIQDSRQTLDSKPEGIELSSLPLNTDEEFRKLETAYLKAIHVQDGMNAEKIQWYRDNLNTRAHELAKEQVKKDLETLSISNKGLPLNILRPHTDEKFSELMSQLRSLKEGTDNNEDAALSLHRLIQTRLDELTSEKLRNERCFLEPLSHGIALEFLNLEKDPKFSELEAKLVKERNNSIQNDVMIQELQEALLDRTNEIIEATIQDDLRTLPPSILDIPIAVLRPHDNKSFIELLNKKKELEKTGSGDSCELEHIHTEMTQICNSLAQDLLKNDRDYIKLNTDLVSLNDLPLLNDPIFHELEVKRALIKSSKEADKYKLSKVENELNDCVNQLAEKILISEYTLAGNTVKGVPLKLVQPHKDPIFRKIIEEYRAAKQDPNAEKESVHDLQEKLKNRAEELVDSLLYEERQFLNKQPLGFNISELNPDEDPTFMVLNSDRVCCLCRSPDEGISKVEAIEKKMNDRLLELARMKLKSDLSGVNNVYSGLNIDDLDIYHDIECTELLREMRSVRENQMESGTEKSLIEQLELRISELAKEKLDGSRYFLRNNVSGVSLDELQLDQDQNFLKMESKRLELRKTDPIQNKLAVLNLENEMNAYVQELLEKVLQEDFQDVSQTPGGIPIDLLRPREDSKVNTILAALRRARHSGSGQEKHVKELNYYLEERLEELSDDLIHPNRELLGKSILGIPFDSLPLSSDDEFHNLEVKCGILVASGLSVESEEVSNIREKMKERAVELAEEKLREEFSSVAAEPLGIPLGLLKPQEDELICQYLKDLRRLRTKSMAGTRGVLNRQNEINEQIKERVFELAEKALYAHREKLSLGDIKAISLDELQLNSEKQFKELELRRAILSLKNKEANAGAIEDIDQAINQHVKNIAEEQLKNELSNLQLDEAMLDKINPLDDPQFIKSLRKLRRLVADSNYHPNDAKTIQEQLVNRFNVLSRIHNDGPLYFLSGPTNGFPLHVLPLKSDPIISEASMQYHELLNDDMELYSLRLEILRKRMNERVLELADLEKQKDFDGVPDQIYGIPIASLSPREDEVIQEIISKLREERYQSPSNPEAIQNHTDELTYRLTSLANELIRRDRRFLEDLQLDVSLADLPLDTDETFQSLEKDRAMAKWGENKAIRKKLLEFESGMRTRVKELAAEHLQHDFDSLDQAPGGIPLNLLPIHTFPDVLELIQRLRDLNKNPQPNAEAIENLIEQTNALLEMKVLSIRKQNRNFLEKFPLSIPQTSLDLDHDSAFLALETKRACLELENVRAHKNMIQELDEKMNERLYVLATAKIEEDRSYLKPSPSGIPLSCFSLEDDPEFKRLITRHRELRQCETATEALRSLEDDMNRHIEKIAEELLSSCRSRFLSAPGGIPLDELLEEGDEIFKELELTYIQRKMKGRTGDEIHLKKLEDQINMRLEELAKIQISKDREGVLDEPGGIPIELLQLNHDPQFSKLAQKRRRLIRQKNAGESQDDALLDIVEALNKRAVEKANEILGDPLTFLDNYPLGIPLSMIPYKSDPIFSSLMLDRGKLILKDPRRNTIHIHEIETQLNSRLTKIAKHCSEEDMKGLPTSFSGVPVATLEPYRDNRCCAIFLEMREIKQAQVLDEEKLSHAKNLLVRCLEDLAKAKLEGAYWFLDKEPEGILLESLHVNKDPIFVDLEKQRNLLLNNHDALDQVRSLEEQLNKRAHELAKMQLEADIESIDHSPCGIPLEILEIRKDSVFNKLIMELREEKNEKNSNKFVMDRIINQMSQRSAEIAQDVINRQRDEIFEDLESIIPLDVLPLTKDSKFHSYEIQRLIMAYEDPIGNSSKVGDLKISLQERLSELIEEQLKEDLKGLKQEPEGIPLSLLSPHSDPEFRLLASRLRALQSKESSSKDTKDIEFIRSEMDEYCVILARRYRKNERGFLPPVVAGIPIEYLPLDNDFAFLELERKRILSISDPGKVNTIPSLEADLTNYVEDFANRLILEDYDQLAPSFAVRLSMVKPHLNKNFLTAASSMWGEKSKKEYDSELCKSLFQEMKDRCSVLVDAFLVNCRRFLNLEPEGILLADLHLKDDLEFCQMEEELLSLYENKGENEGRIADVEKKMNDYVHQKALDLRKKDRAYLPQEIYGIPVGILAIDSDLIFQEKEKERARLKTRGARVNAPKIAELENGLKERLSELGLAQLSSDLQDLPSVIRGIPISLLSPHKDVEFSCLLEKRRNISLKESPPNEQESEDLLTVMHKRLDDLALLALKDKSFLSDVNWEISLENLHLDDDVLFTDLAGQRLELFSKDQRKNSAKIKALEDQMKERISELIELIKRDDLSILDPLPYDFDIKLLDIHHNNEISSLFSKWRKPDISEEERQSVKNTLNELVRKAFDTFLEANRSYLSPTPYDIPLSIIPLNDDAEFMELEAERFKLKSLEGNRHTAALHDVEACLKQRVIEITREMLAGERGYLNTALLKVDLKYLPLETDSVFHKLEVERFKTKSKGLKYASQVLEIEDKLNDRLVDLADAVLEEDLNGIEPRPYGVPLHILTLHKDEEFTSMLPEFRNLRQNPQQHSKRIREIQQILNDRANEIACDLIETIRTEILDPKPGGISREFLDLTSDKTFSRIEREYLDSRYKKNLTNTQKLSSLIEKMNNRLLELAREKHEEERHFLNPISEGISLKLLPLNTDPLMRELESERAALIKNHASQDQISEIEAKIQDHVSNLAKDLKKKARSTLISEPLGIPLSVLSLEGDRKLQSLEGELIKLISSSNQGNAAQINSLQDQINSRIVELANVQLYGNLPKIIEAAPCGIPIENLDIEKDSICHDALVSRLIEHGRGDSASAEKINALDQVLVNRARELAFEELRKTRTYLDSAPEGIPLEELNLEGDTEYMRNEARLYMLKRQVKKNDGAIKALQSKLTFFIRDKARVIVESDLKTIGPLPNGVRAMELGLHVDDRFRSLARDRRILLRNKEYNKKELEALVEAMYKRACELSGKASGESRAFLGEEVEGIAINELPLESDEAFIALEFDYRQLLRGLYARNSNVEDNPKILELRQKLKERATVLAFNVFAAERLTYLSDVLHGVPTSLFSLNTHEKFRQLEVRRHKLVKFLDKSSLNANKIVEVEEKLIELVKEIVNTVLFNFPFLKSEYDGVPVSLLSLSQDQVIQKLGRKYALEKQKSDNVARLNIIESKIVQQVKILASTFVTDSRKYLDPEPLGVELKYLPLATDTAFKRLEKEYLSLSGKDAEDPKVKTIIQSMISRTVQLAGILLTKERRFLDQEPLGVSLEELSLNSDKIFTSLEKKRRELRKDSKSSATEIDSIQEEMMDRLISLANNYLTKERVFLPQIPDSASFNTATLWEDKPFHTLELQLRKLSNFPAKNADEIKSVQQAMCARFHELFSSMGGDIRGFLVQEPLGVPLSYLHDDAGVLEKLEENYRNLKLQGNQSPESLLGLEEEMNEYVMKLAENYIRNELSFLGPKVNGVAIGNLKLMQDKTFTSFLKEARQLRHKSPENKVGLDEIQANLRECVEGMAKRYLDGNRGFLQKNPLGVALSFLPLDEDELFKKMERKRRKLMLDPKTNARILKKLEQKMNEQVVELAKEFIQRERDFLDQEPAGVPLLSLPLDSDKEFMTMQLELRTLQSNPIGKEKEISGIQERMSLRLAKIAMESLGTLDESFYNMNRKFGEKWVPIYEVYPSGMSVPLLPDAPNVDDVVSHAGMDIYFTPFAAVLANLPKLLERIFITKIPAKGSEYRFIFFDPSGISNELLIDERIPIGLDGLPIGVCSPTEAWWPILLEKAYVKFIGGYQKLSQCTPHETLKDLTGRPVSHIPLDQSLSKAVYAGDPTTINFWTRLRYDLKRGDLFIATALEKPVDGFHSQAIYGIMGIFMLREDSEDLTDVVIQLHNGYQHEPVYKGPFDSNDLSWAKEIGQANFDGSRKHVLYVPALTFLANFLSIQRCHINCGDRITVPGVWDSESAGGYPKYTSFRKNPIFVLKNETSRLSNVLVELRHTPSGTSDKGYPYFPPSGLVHMTAVDPHSPPSPFITMSSHKFLRKGLIMDGREITSVISLPPNSTSLVIPYTKEHNVYGRFQISVYSGLSKVSFAALNTSSFAAEPFTKNLCFTSDNDDNVIQQCISVSNETELHVLLRQMKVKESESARKEDIRADNEISMSFYASNSSYLTSTGKSANWREQSFSLKSVAAGIYTVVMQLYGEATEPCPVQLSILSAKDVEIKFIKKPDDIETIIPSNSLPTPINKSLPALKSIDLTQDFSMRQTSAGMLGSQGTTFVTIKPKKMLHRKAKK